MRYDVHETSRDAISRVWRARGRDLSQNFGGVVVCGLMHRRCQHEHHSRKAQGTQPNSAIMIPSWLEEHCSRLSRNDPELENLNLNIRRLDTEMLEALAKSIERNNAIHTLNLTSSLIKASLLPLTRVISRHPSLKVLHLSYNRLSESDEIAALARALETNNALTELYLDHNEIDAKGATILASALRENQTLQVLHLSSNQIHDTGAKAFANVLVVDNTTLKRLSLERNRITSIGVEALLTALKSNVTILHLEVDKRQTSANQELDLALQTNRAGRHLLRRQDVRPDFWPYVLGRISRQPDMLYFFLKEMPNLYRRSK